MRCPCGIRQSNTKHRLLSGLVGISLPEPFHAQQSRHFLGLRSVLISVSDSVVDVNLPALPENCCPPATQGLGYDIANNIGRMARVFGCITTFKAYLDISVQPPKATTLRSELQLSGVSLIDCPHNGKKEVVDKMIMGA